MRLHDIPNLITGLRIFLVVPILWFLLQEQYVAALLLFVVAGFSDAMDGYLAKHHGWTSQLGGMLDPLADKLLLMGTIMTLGWLDDLPAWLVILVIVRDLVIISGAISYHYLIERFRAAPLAVSKANTLTQLTLVLAVIFSKGVMPLQDSLLTLLIGLTALTTVVSGIAYVWSWGRKALDRRKRLGASRKI